MKKFWMTLLVCVAAAVGAGAQTVSTVAVFDGHTGNFPYGTIIQGLDGNLYGTTEYGGGGAIGNVYKVSPDGTLSNLYSLCPKYPTCPNGTTPWGGLVLATNGNFYGSTTDVFQYGYVLPGSIFELGPTGTFKTLLYFDPSGDNGGAPLSSLVQGNDGNLFGAGNSGGKHQSGTIFRMTLSGQLTTAYDFCSKLYCSDGVFPNAITLGSDGNFSGTTLYGGMGQSCPTGGCGTVFKLTPGGGFTTLYNFCSLANCADGAYPTGNVVLAEDGNLYGATVAGGTGTNCVLSSPYNCGTFFKLTPSGVLTTLHSFCSVGTNCLDGSNSYGAIMEGTDGNFYGTTWQGGANSSHLCFNADSGCGTVYQITKAGELTTIYNFCGQDACADGYRPLGGLMQATNGLIYGTTEYGGTMVNGGAGVVFSVDAGMAPFVQAVINAGSVGKRVTILGNNLRGTTAVSFGGVNANFTVVSATEITATVPRGAQTGWITVTTPGGTLQSRNRFSVTQ